jgi:hypothetical protein
MVKKDAARYGGKGPNSSALFALWTFSDVLSMRPSLAHEETVFFTASKKTSNISLSNDEITDESVVSRFSDWPLVR